MQPIAPGGDIQGPLVGDERPRIRQADVADQAIAIAGRTGLRGIDPPQITVALDDIQPTTMPGRAKGIITARGERAHQPIRRGGAAGLARINLPDLVVRVVDHIQTRRSGGGGGRATGRPCAGLEAVPGPHLHLVGGAGSEVPQVVGGHRAQHCAEIGPVATAARPGAQLVVGERRPARGRRRPTDPQAPHRATERGHRRRRRGAGGRGRPGQVAHGTGPVCCPARPHDRRGDAVRVGNGIAPDPTATADAAVASIATAAPTIVVSAFPAVTTQQAGPLQVHGFQQNAAAGATATPRSRLVAATPRVPASMAIATDGPVDPLGLPGGSERPATGATSTAARERPPAVVIARIRPAPAPTGPGLLDRPRAREISGAIRPARARAATGPVPAMAGPTAAVGAPVAGAGPLTVRATTRAVRITGAVPSSASKPLAVSVNNCVRLEPEQARVLEPDRDAPRPGHRDVRFDRNRREVVDRRLAARRRVGRATARKARHRRRAIEDRRAIGPAAYVEAGWPASRPASGGGRAAG